MTTDRGAGDPLDRRLLDLFSPTPGPAALAGIDARIERALQAWSPGRGRASRDRLRRRVVVVGLLAAAFVLAGATGRLQALYQFMAGPFDLPWHRGVEVNLSQTVDGYRVTVDRAYADATRLALAISVVDERQRPGTTQLSAMSTIVSDDAGEYTSGGGAVSSPDGPYAAANVAWKTPALLPLPSGPRRLHVVVPFIMVRDDATPPPDSVADWNPWREVAGPWTFDFEIVVDGGTAIEPGVAVEADGVRVTLDRVIAAPSIVRLEVRAEGEIRDERVVPIGQVSHDGRTVDIVVGDFSAKDGTIALTTDGGVGDASGHWIVTLRQADDGGGYDGPWILEFDVP